MRPEHYWNNKRPKQTILYAGRPSPSDKDGPLINIDARRMIWADEWSMERIAGALNGTCDYKALWCQQWTRTNIKYNKTDTPWLFPNETYITGEGGKEDGCFLMASLMLNAGIPAWRVRVAAGTITTKAQTQESHYYVTYCRETDNNWVALDWTFLEDSSVLVQNKVLLKDNAAYDKIWFSFNNLYGWSETNLGIVKGL